MRDRNVLKWAVYAFALVVIAILQGTPHALPSIAGTLPLIIIPCVISIAVFEGVTPGAVFAIIGGLIWDLESGKAFGFNAFFLMVTCIAAALLIENLFRNTFFSGLVFSLITTFIMEVVTWFFFIYLRGNEQFVAAFFRVILPTIIYTNVFLFPFYFGARLVNRRLSAKEKDL